jgi:hypothetical protein
MIERPKEVWVLTICTGKLIYGMSHRKSVHRLMLQHQATVEYSRSLMRAATRSLRPLSHKAQRE